MLRTIAPNSIIFGLTLKVALPIEDLAARHLGVTKAIADSFVEAAGVCLDRHCTSPTEFIVEGPSGTQVAIVNWPTTSQRVAGAWANEIDATEWGAYGMALAAVELNEGLLAVRRAETRTGCDYYVAPVGSDVEDLEEWQRLEVSGINKSDEDLVKKRVSQKIAQAQDGNSNLPAVVAVVGFSSKHISLASAVSS